VFIKHQNWKKVKQIGVQSKRLYRLQFDSPMTLVSSNKSNSGRDLDELWHRRMGHLHHGALRMLRETITGVLELGTKHDDVCKGCILGKYAKAVFPKQTIQFSFFMILLPLLGYEALSYPLIELLQCLIDS